MKPDTSVQLGDFVFAEAEIPESIPFGGSQRTAVHELIGGTRTIDRMGRADAELSWSGIFTGAAAVDRARYLDTIRVQGNAQTLTWGAFSYSVLIAEFKADYRRAYRIPYHVTAQVIADLSNPTTTLTPPSIDAAVNVDFDASFDLSATVGDSVLSTLLGVLDTAIGAVSSFANAAQSVINSVLQPLSAVQSRVALLIKSSNNTLSNVTSFGGVLPYYPGSGAALSSQSLNAQQWQALFSLQVTVGRLMANLSTINTAPKTITVAGGNLYRIAQVEYGDPLSWTAIAKANGLTDPFIFGTVTLFIPANPDTAGGVLNA